MNNVVVFGIEGQDVLWVADLGNGTVTALETPLSDTFAGAAALRKQGGTVIKGVDFAVSVPSASEVASGFLEE